jgi:GT2 family glycosyltransferase
MSRPGVSIVVPNYNGAELLRANGPAWLAAARAYPGESEVIVVDDASSDDSVGVLARELSDVKVVRHEKNQGFGGACGSGVAAARHPIVVLLNSDAIPAEPGFLEPLVACFERDAAVFAVASLVTDEKGAVYKNAVNLPRIKAGELRWEGVPADDVLALARLPRQRPLEIHTLFPVGCAFAVDRARFLEVGGFDPLYRPFYHEDVDLGLAGWVRGWKCLVEPRSRVIHAWGGTINRLFKAFKVRLASRSHRVLLSWKHAEGAWRSELKIGLVRRVLTRWLKLDVLYYVALVQALARLGEARRARARERAATKVPLLEVFERVKNDWPPRELAEAKALPVTPAATGATPRTP